MPLQIGVVLALVGGVVIAGVTYYCTPKYTRVGYQPLQPVPFSHAIHARQLGMDCRYCHNTVEQILVFQHPGRVHVHELPQPGAQE